MAAACAFAAALAPGLAHGADDLLPPELKPVVGIEPPPPVAPAADPELLLDLPAPSVPAPPVAEPALPPPQLPAPQLPVPPLPPVPDVVDAAAGSVAGLVESGGSIPTPDRQPERKSSQPDRDSADGESRRDRPVSRPRADDRKPADERPLPPADVPALPCPEGGSVPGALPPADGLIPAPEPPSVSACAENVPLPQLGDTPVPLPVPGTPPPLGPGPVLGSVPAPDALPGAREDADPPRTTSPGTTPLPKVSGGPNAPVSAPSGGPRSTGTGLAPAKVSAGTERGCAAALVRPDPSSRLLLESPARVDTTFELRPRAAPVRAGPSGSSSGERDPPAAASGDSEPGQAHPAPSEQDLPSRSSSGGGAAQFAPGGSSGGAPLKGVLVKLDGVRTDGLGDRVTAYSPSARAAALSRRIAKPG